MAHPLLTHLRTSVIQFLRRTERYTKTDNIYLAKNGLLVFLNQAFNVLNGFILYILIARYLPKEIYGEYKYLLSLFSLFSIATITGMDNALAKSVAHGYEGSLKVAFRKRLYGGVVGSGIALIAAAYYASTGNARLSIGIILLAIFAPWIYAANVYGAYITSKKQFGTYTKISILTTAVSFIGMAAAFILLKDPIQLFFAFLLTSSSVLFGYLFARSEQRNDTTDPELIRYAIHLSVLDIFGIVANSIDSILAFHLLGVAPLAVYALATIPVDQIKGFLKTVPSIAMPKFAVHTFADVREHLNQKLLLYTGVTGLAVLSYILLAPLFFRIFFPNYLSSVLYSQIYSLSLIFTMPASLLLTLFTAKGLKKEITLFNTTNYSIQVVLLVVGAMTYGLWGLIISRIASRIIMFLITYVMVWRVNIPDNA